MDFLLNTLLSGILYDCMKEGVAVTYQKIFGNFIGYKMDHNNPIYVQFLDELREINKNNYGPAKEEAVNNLIREDKYCNVFVHELYSTNFAKRLDYVLYLINQEERMFGEVNLEYLGEFLGFISVNELKKYYLHEEEPEYRFIEAIAKKIGVNTEWLKRGTDLYPFKSSLPGIDYAERVLQYAQEGTFIFAIRDVDKRKEIAIIIRVNDIKYEIFSKGFVFHSDVGATGMNQLCSTYMFLKKISLEKECDLLNVHLVPTDIFEELIMGKCYPGIVYNYSAKNKSNILVDFIDIKSTYRTQENYLGWYGEDFVKCQQLITKKLGIDM